MFRAIAAAGLVILACPVAGAFEGTCLIEVGGTTYLDGACDIEMEADGSFSVGVGDESRAKYFAYVDLAPGAGGAAGYWNGPDGESHAHYGLGMLSRQGGCWVNDAARVCAWR